MEKYRKFYNKTETKTFDYEGFSEFVQSKKGETKLICPERLIYYIDKKIHGDATVDIPYVIVV